MSIKKIILLITGGFLIGFLGVFISHETAIRNIASELPPPKLKLTPWGHSLLGKMHQAMTVKILAVGGIPESEDQELRLRAEVTLNRPIDQEVKFQWTLPPDASVVSGELEDSWPNLHPGQTATTEIVLTGVAKESFAKTVSLHVAGLSEGIRFGAVGSWATNSAENSQPQNSKLVLKKSEAAAKLEKVHQ